MTPNENLELSQGVSRSRKLTSTAVSCRSVGTQCGQHKWKWRACSQWHKGPESRDECVLPQGSRAVGDTQVYKSTNTAMCHLMMGICSEQCIISWCHRGGNITRGLHKRGWYPSIIAGDLWTHARHAVSTWLRGLPGKHAILSYRKCATLTYIFAYLSKGGTADLWERIDSYLLKSLNLVA